MVEETLNAMLDAETVRLCVFAVASGMNGRERGRIRERHPKTKAAKSA